MLKFLDDFISILEKHHIYTGWISWAVAFVILIFPALSVFLNLKRLNSTRDRFNLDKLLARQEHSRIEISEINKELTEFYLPLRFYINQSKMLYDIFALEEKNFLNRKGKRFNTLRHLCDGESFSDKDRLILDKIIDIGDSQNNLIEKENRAVDNEPLSILLSKYSAHLKILKLANAEKSLRDYDLYKSYTFPIELPGAIESKIIELSHRRDSIINGSQIKKRKLKISRYTRKSIDYYNQTISIPEGSDIIEFQKIAKSGGLICDLGCGSGRDSIFFIKNGFRVHSSEPSTDLADLAKSYPFIFVKEEFIQDMMYPSKFDAVWCSAVLQHIHPKEIEKSINNISRMLKPNGVAYLSFRTTITPLERISGNAYKHAPKKVTKIIESHGLKLISEKSSKSSKDGKNDFYSYFISKI